VPTSTGTTAAVNESGRIAMSQVRGLRAIEAS